MLLAIETCQKYETIFNSDALQSVMQESRLLIGLLDSIENHVGRMAVVAKKMGIGDINTRSIEDDVRRARLFTEKLNHDINDRLGRRCSDEEIIRKSFQLCCYLGYAYTNETSRWWHYWEDEYYELVHLDRISPNCQLVDVLPEAKKLEINSNNVQCITKIVDMMMAELEKSDQRIGFAKYRNSLAACFIFGRRLCWIR